MVRDGFAEGPLTRIASSVRCDLSPQAERGEASPRQTDSIKIILSGGLLAVRAGAGDFDDREFWRKARGARRGREALCHGSGRNFTNRAAALADQEGHQRGG